MYQGKYAAKESASPRPRTAPAKKPEAPAAKEDVQEILKTPEVQSAPAEVFAASETPGEASRPAAQRHAPASRPAAARPQRSTSSSNPRRRPAPARRRRKKAPRRGTVIFYSIYAACIAVFFIALACALPPLKAWLVKYEASQPQQKSEEVFQQLFAQPDWKDLYAKSGQQDTAYENADTYAAYMTQKLGDQKLSYMETSAGLSGNHKYLVKIGDEKVAAFILSNKAPADAEIPDWQFASVETFFTRDQTVTVNHLPGFSVFINGVKLDESHTVRITETKAEAYLPEGVHGYRMEQQSLSGLLMPPTVTIQDEAGKEVPVKQDPETGIYSPDLPGPAPMTEEEKEIVLGAAKADAQWAIRAISKGELRKHFDGNSKIYNDLTSALAFIQSYTGYVFDESVTEVKDFYRYSDNFFSANAVLKMDVTRPNGYVKTFNLDTTYFFTRNSAGKYLVTDVSNIPVQEQVHQVRLRFVSGDKEMGSMMLAPSAKTMTLPQVTPPQGKVLDGWAEKTVDENGKITMNILFTPAEDGTVQIPESMERKPMTLHAVFKNA